jgi:hypothetical protein
MPIHGPARDQYLTTVAKIIQSGAAQSPAALEVAVQEVARELGTTHNVAAQDLFELTPKTWLSDPNGFATRKEAESFVAVSGVLNVPMAVVSPIATRGVQNARDADITIAINRSDAVKANPRPPEFLEEIHLDKTPPAEIVTKLKGLFAHPRFADLYGSQTKNASFFDNAARAIAGVVQDLQRKGVPGPNVLAGGVPVAGPAYEAGLGVVGTMQVLPEKMSLIALAYGGLRALLITNSLGEADLRGAILQTDNMLVSGRKPDLFSLKGVVGDDGSRNVVVVFEESKVHAFQKSSLSRDELGVRLFGAVKTAAADFDAHANAMVPYALINNPTARQSPVVQQRLQAEAARVGGQA